METQTLQVQHEQLSARVLVRPVAEGQHGFFQKVSWDDFIPVVVIKLAEISSDAFLDGEPLTRRMTVQQEHLQEPAGKTHWNHWRETPESRISHGKRPNLTQETPESHRKYPHSFEVFNFV